MPAVIPEMTNQLSPYWPQPDPKEIVIDDRYALMTKATLEKLLVYNSSVPTGAYEGKMWRSFRTSSDGSDCWLLRWYEPSPVSSTHPGGMMRLRIATREVLIA